nr:hypothetical protein [Candidatus Sigynarchaeota archaeon]
MPRRVIILPGGVSTEKARWGKSQLIGISFFSIFIFIHLNSLKKNTPPQRVFSEVSFPWDGERY